MQWLRFKEKFNEPLRNPQEMVIDGHRAPFKVLTSRNRPLKFQNYHVVNAPGGLYSKVIVRTGIVIKILSFEPRKIGSYSPEELISDIGHMDTTLFLDELSKINGGKEYDLDSVLYMHRLKFVMLSEELRKKYEQCSFGDFEDSNETNGDG
jgi:hypothetical protein